MENNSLEFIDYPESELVIGLVAPTGTDTDYIQLALKERLENFGYKPNEIKLSNLLRRFELGVEIEDRTKFERIQSLMEAGDILREKAKRGDALALMAVSDISKGREKKEVEGIGEIKFPIPKAAHILDSLKHPDEVIALRRIYGVGFFLIGVFASEESRLKYLNENDLISLDQAQILIDTDQNENRPSGLGQRTRDTFYLSDAFINLDKGVVSAKKQLWRILDSVDPNLVNFSSTFLFC